MSWPKQRWICLIAILLASPAVCNAQFGTSHYGRMPGPIPDQARVAVRTLLVQVDHLVEDMEVDLVRDPISERLLVTAQEVRDEAEQLAVSVERAGELGHVVRDFTEFDAPWHRLTRQAARYAADDRHLQRNLARVSQADAELHRLLRVPAPVNVQEVLAMSQALHRAAAQLRDEIELDLRGVRCQREMIARANALEETAEHLEASIARGADMRHMRDDFEAVDAAWLQLASNVRELTPMRFDHVQRATAAVATAESQLRFALGYEANPEQFTCFRPEPSELRRNLPYAASGSTVVIPNGWRVAPVPPPGPHPSPQGAAIPGFNSSEPGMSLVLGFLFGGDPRESKADKGRPRHLNDDDDDDNDHGREHSAPPPPPIRKGPPPGQPVTAPPGRDSLAPVPPKPTESAVQAKIERNLARLSPDDRTAAAAQRICPVNGELLGSHGTPIKVKIKDNSGPRREVFVCSDDCEDELDDHPHKYMDRIKGQK